MRKDPVERLPKHQAGGKGIKDLSASPEICRLFWKWASPARQEKKPARAQRLRHLGVEPAWVQLNTRPDQRGAEDHSRREVGPRGGKATPRESGVIVPERGCWLVGEKVQKR